MNHNFGFNIQVFAEPLDHPAPPEQRRVMVRVMEMPVKNTSKAVITELGRVNDLTAEHLDTIAACLQSLLRGAVQGAVDGLAYRIKNPGMAAVIDKFAAQWSPPGVPKSFFNDKLGEPYVPEPEKPPLEGGQRVAWRDGGETVHHGFILAISDVCVEATPRITVKLDDGSYAPCYEDALRPLLCSDCGEPQFQTDSGPVCKNGHGGAPPRRSYFHE